MPTFYEFFAGGGMARAGLGESWQCVFANDYDEKKVVAYNENWAEGWTARDIRGISPSDLGEYADLAWASFPCQDLSLAGNYAGLSGQHSGMFWAFWKILQSLEPAVHPAVVVLENVCGALTSHGGRDFRTLIGALGDGGYRAGALVMDASLFLPHSRPRLFIVGVRKEHHVPETLVSSQPHGPFHNQAVVKAWRGLSSAEKAFWLWWSLAPPTGRRKSLEEIVDWAVPWDSADKTKHLLGLMLPVHHEKVLLAKRAKTRLLGTIYKRTRPDASGNRAQRAEVRFDGLAGCLRTPGGGSSRQTLLMVNGDEVRSRFFSSRELARLMGLADTYRMPQNFNDSCHLMGDGLAVPVVRHLAVNLLAPLVANTQQSQHRTSNLLSDCDLRAKIPCPPSSTSENAQSLPSLVQ